MSQPSARPSSLPFGVSVGIYARQICLRLSSSTLSVYVVAIAAHHAPVGEQSLGRNPLVTRFLRGYQEAEASGTPKDAYLDLAVVLEALSKAPFEPLEEVPWRFLTVKTVFILAISSLKRVGDLQALSVAPIMSRVCAWYGEEHFCTPGRGMSLRCPQLIHSQLFFRHSVHLPFGILTRKS